LRLLVLAVLQIGVDRRPDLSAPANLLLFDAIRVCSGVPRCRWARYRSCAIWGCDGGLMRRFDIFPATGDDGAVSEGRRAFTRPRASRLIIPGDLSLRANRLLDHARFSNRER
jgi:hypothetical protein